MFEAAPNALAGSAHCPSPRRNCATLALSGVGTAPPVPSTEALAPTIAPRSVLRTLIVPEGSHLPVVLFQTKACPVTVAAVPLTSSALLRLPVTVTEGSAAARHWSRLTAVSGGKS